MKTTVNNYDFRKAFESHNRNSNFSYDGLDVLFDYLEQYEREAEQEIELDVIDLCCSYEENSYEEIIRQYDIEIDEDEDVEDQVREYLEDKTTVCGPVSGGFVYQSF